MSEIIILDCDGVILNYNRAYPKVWKSAFGVDLELKREGCFHAFNEYDCLFKSDEEKQQFYAAFTEEHWATMPPALGKQVFATRRGQSRSG
jgi:beta-phosphoglucomutase-like phosphatase (HAD superfamily)